MSLHRVDLLDPQPQGIIVLGDRLKADGGSVIADVYWCTNGQADRARETRFVNRGLMTSWEDIPDVVIPLLYLRWVMTIINQMEHGGVSAAAIGKLRTFLLALFPYVAREMTSREKERLKDLFLIPSALAAREQCAKWSTVLCARRAKGRIFTVVDLYHVDLNGASYSVVMTPSASMSAMSSSVSPRISL